MFSFNPISYFIKSFIRLFSKKFFWVILILFCLFLGYIIFLPEVNAQTNFYLDTNYFSDSDVERCQNLVGSIWNNENYDIWLFYHASRIGREKCYFYFDTTNLSDNTVYRFNSTDSGTTNGCYVYPFWFYDKETETHIGNYCNDYLIHELYNDWGEGYSQFPPSANPGWGTNMFSFLSNRYGLLIKPIRTHFNMEDENGNIYFAATNPRTIAPYFITTDYDIEEFNFDYLKISGGTTDYITTNPITGESSNSDITLSYIYDGVSTNIDINPYITVTNNKWVINIPKNALTNNVIVRNGAEFSYILTYKPNDYSSQYTVSRLNLTYRLTEEEQEQINQDSDKQVQGEILQQQQQTNDKLDNLQNTITDTTVPNDSEFDLPTIDVNDVTSNFFDTLFTGIYNAFNIDEDVQISFNLFSKTFTINSADFRMLNDSNFNVLRLLLESSWYFAIGYMILKDIRLIFDKIKNGNIENAVSNDIKADMV